VSLADMRAAPIRAAKAWRSAIRMAPRDNAIGKRAKLAVA